MAQNILQARPIPASSGCVFQMDFVTDLLQLGDLAITILFVGRDSCVTYLLCIF